VRAKKVADQMGGVEKALAAIKALRDFEGQEMPLVELFAFQIPTDIPVPFIPFRHGPH